MQSNFGASAPFTVGIEEELQLVTPDSLELAAKIGALLDARDAAGLPDGFPEDAVAPELSASCVELRTPPCPTVGEAAGGSVRLREAVGILAEGCGVRIAAAGAHPFSDPVSQPITAADRYRRVEERMGWTARMQAIYGLHVHVAVPDEEHAVGAVSALSRYVPLFLALSANSPFWDGADTRLASVRAKVFALVPRSGLPPAFRTWEEFEGYVERLVAAGLLPDYSWCWWDVRPHPRLGTVELRAPDAQTDPARTAVIAALAQCVVATAGEHAPEDPLLTEENKWIATRHGLDATFHDFSTGQTVPARELARALVERLNPVAQDLGCEAELDGVSEILAAGDGAQQQRRVFRERGSLVDVARHLAERTIPRP